MGIAFLLTVISTAWRPGYGLRVVCTARDTDVENAPAPRAAKATRFTLKTSWCVSILLLPRGALDRGLRFGTLGDHSRIGRRWARGRGRDASRSSQGI